MARHHEHCSAHHAALVALASVWLLKQVRGSARAELALRLQISNADFSCLSHDPNNSHRHCTCEPQTSGQCGDCRCMKSTGLNKYPVCLHSTHHPDVASVHFTGCSPANVARCDCASRSGCGDPPANKNTANASTVRANSHQEPEPLPIALMFHRGNKEDLSLALRLENEPNVARFGCSRRIPKITGRCASVSPSCRFSRWMQI